MRHIVIAGAGKIGSLVALLLLQSGDYQILLLDKDFNHPDCQRLGEHPHLQRVQIDVTDAAAMEQVLTQGKYQAIISSLPYFFNVLIAELAYRCHLHYFDLTEDRAVTAKVKQLSKAAKHAFVPQCGLAPGFIGIVTNHLIHQFETIDSVKMRVGALPTNTNHALKYSLTWSTEGLINEYCNPCQALRAGKLVELDPLEALEIIDLDGTEYEAFNTSGGLGNLAQLYEGKVQELDYKTIRYPGHCEKMRFLLHDMKLIQDKPLLKHILEVALPKTYQDVVLIYVAVTGKKLGELVEENFHTKIYPQQIDGHVWSAIQVATASSLCSVVDIILHHVPEYHGFVFQEQINLTKFLQNRFAQCFAGRK